MKKMIVLALFVAFMMPLTVPQVFAAEKAAQAGISTIPARSHGLDGQSSQAGIVEAGNKFCPVMGGPVSGKNFVVYEGKRYGLCCPGCDKKFLSDPEKYIAKIERQETVPVAPKGTVVPIDPASEEMEKDMEQGSL